MRPSSRRAGFYRFIVLAFNEYRLSRSILATRPSQHDRKIRNRLGGERLLGRKIRNGVAQHSGLHRAGRNSEHANAMRLALIGQALTQALVAP